MVSKICPSCSNSTPLATKTCSCGYTFFGKKSKNQGKEDGEAKDPEREIEASQDMKTIDNQVELIYEDMASFKISQCIITDKLEKALTELTANHDDHLKEFKSYQKKMQQEFELAKAHVTAKVNDLAKEMEEKYRLIIRDQKAKISSLERKVGDLNKRIRQIESESSEDEGSVDDEEPQVDVEPTIATSNRFDALLTENQQSEPQQVSDHIEANNSQTEQSQNSNKDTKIQNILILSDSMMRRISEKKLSPENNIEKRYVRGGTNEMDRFIYMFESDVNFDKILIHTGTNDIGNLTNDEIIDNQKKIIQECKSRWSDAEIIISGIIHHKTNTTKNDRIDVINKGTNEVCRAENVYFMNNSHITRKRSGTIDSEVFYDNLHLNDNNGIRKLAANLKKHLKLSQNGRENTNKRRSQNWKTNRGHWQSNQSRYKQQHGYEDHGRFEHKNKLGGLLSALKPLAEWISSTF